MSKIIQLGADVIPKIAAGEVIENPASVIKELIENSLDASAQSIFIDIENFGFRKIKVIDDGEGMDKEDLLKCFDIHSTSKISSIDDLSSIKSFGFRGEALSSISAVSNVKIKSKTQVSDFGYSIEIEDNKLKNVEPIGIYQGTVVEVDSIFSKIPARKKFLKNPQTEYRNILKLLTNYILGHPHVSFRFSHDGNLILNFTSKHTLDYRITQLLGQDFFSSLLSVTAENEYIKLDGYITKPHASSFNKDTQFLYVNGRAVTNNTVSGAVKDAYGKMIDAKSFPGFLLNINLGHDLVDVNVHPRKETVSFWNDSSVYDFVLESIKKVLESNDLTYVQGYDTDILEASKKAAPFQYQTLKDSFTSWRPEESQRENTEQSIFQINKTYIATPTKEGLVLIDQHAAHESILYTQYIKAYESNFDRSEKYIPESPVFVDLTVMQMETYKENFQTILDLGFDIDVFGSTSLKVISYPQILCDHNIKVLLAEVLSDLESGKKIKDVDFKTKQTIAFLSCRSAVKAGDYLTYAEQKNIVKKLDDTPDTYTCPHGRPVKIIIKGSELARMFKRIK